MENGLGGPADVDLIVLGRVVEWEAPEVQVLRKLGHCNSPGVGEEKVSEGREQQKHTVSHISQFYGQS